MSELDSDDCHSRSRLDLESDHPHYSLVDSTINFTPIHHRDTAYEEPISTSILDVSLPHNDLQKRYSSSSLSNVISTNITSADQNTIRRGVITESNIIIDLYMQ